MTIDQQDGQTGLRNEYLGLVRGTVDNQMTVDGKVMGALDPSLAAHTFTVPDLGVSVPLEGVADNAPANAQIVVEFSFVVPDKPGLFRWQCFVPVPQERFTATVARCRALGYMAGELQVG